MSSYPMFDKLRERFSHLVDLEFDVDHDVEWIFNLEESDRMPVWIRWDQIERLRDEPDDEKNAFLLGVSLIHLRRVIERVCERAEGHFHVAVLVEGRYETEGEDPHESPARHFACDVVPNAGLIPWNTMRVATGPDADKIARWLRLLDEDLTADLRLIVNLPGEGDPTLSGGGSLELATRPCEHFIEPLRLS